MKLIYFQISCMTSEVLEELLLLLANLKVVVLLIRILVKVLEVVITG